MILFGNVTVYVSDLDRAVKFYTQTLGLESKMHIPKHYAQVEGPGITIGLHPEGRNPSGSNSPRPGHSERLLIGFSVENLEEAVGKLKERGVKFSKVNDNDKEIRLAYFTDPDGNPLYLAQVVATRI